MLLGNYSVLNKNPGRAFGGSTVSDSRAQWGKSGPARGAFTHISQKESIPSGYVPPYSWVIAIKSGGMATFNTISGSGNVSSGNLAGGLNAEAPLTGSGDITAAALALIISAVAALSGSGTVSGDILGKLEAAADLAGAGDIDGALGALAGLAASLSGSGDLSADIIAKAAMSAGITVSGDLLTAEAVAQSVWAAVAAANNNAGSMGEKLNDAGSASNPWTEVIESGYTAAEIMRLLAAVMAGKSNGGGGTTINFRNLADTKDRITATVDTNGNRSTVVKDAT